MLFSVLFFYSADEWKIEVGPTPSYSSPLLRGNFSPSSSQHSKPTLHKHLTIEVTCTERCYSQVESEEQSSEIKMMPELSCRKLTAQYQNRIDAGLDVYCSRRSGSAPDLLFPLDLAGSSCSSCAPPLLPSLLTQHTTNTCCFVLIERPLVAEITYCMFQLLCTSLCSPASHWFCVLCGNGLVVYGGFWQLFCWTQPPTAAENNVMTAGRVNQSGKVAGRTQWAKK